MHRPTPHPLAVAIFASMLQLPAQAALNAVDQGTYTPENGGFAAWYQDTHGRVLDLCLTKAVSSRVPGAQARRRTCARCCRPRACSTIPSRSSSPATSLTRRSGSPPTRPSMMPPAESTWAMSRRSRPRSAVATLRRRPSQLRPGAHPRRCPHCGDLHHHPPYGVEVFDVATRAVGPST